MKAIKKAPEQTEEERLKEWFKKNKDWINETGYWKREG